MAATAQKHLSCITGEHAPYYSSEHGNYYCRHCNKGMGNAYYKVAKQADSLLSLLAEIREAVRVVPFDPYPTEEPNPDTTPWLPVGLISRIDEAIGSQPELPSSAPCGWCGGNSVTGDDACPACNGEGTVEAQLRVAVGKGFGR